MSDDKERQRRNEAMLDAIERYTDERMAVDYVCEPADDSRSGGQPLIANRKAHTMIIEVLAEWGLEPRSTTPQQLAVATTEALCRAIKQLEDLRQPTHRNVVVAAAPADRIGGAGVVTHGVVGVDTQSDVLKAAGDAIRGLLDIASDDNLDSAQAGRAYAALHDIDTALKGQSK